MNKTLKKLLASTLAVSMLLSAMCGTAWAAEAAPTDAALGAGVTDGAAPDGAGGGEGMEMPDGAGGEGMEMPDGMGGGDEQMSGGTGDSAPDDAAILVNSEGVTSADYMGLVSTGADGTVVVDGLNVTTSGYGDNILSVKGGTTVELKNATVVMNVDGAITSEGQGGGAKYYDADHNEVSAGVAASVDDGSTLYITDSELTVNGAGRYTVAAYNDAVLVVSNSSVIAGGDLGANGATSGVSKQPSNAALLIDGTSRANFSVGKSHTFYYGSECIAEGWAALSTDAAQGLELIAYNTYAEATNGGYGTYADTDCRDYLYGVTFNSAEIGAIISNNGLISVGSGADAVTDKTQDGISPLAYFRDNDESTEAGSVIYAERNCFQMHSPDMMGGGTAGYQAQLTVKNSTLTTVPTEELNASAKMDYTEEYGTAVGTYVDYVKGDILLIKSTGAVIDLDNVEMTSSNGVLIHTIINSDSMSRYLKAGNEGKTVDVTMSNMDVTGDIVHDDYQRDLNLTLTATTLTGASTMATAESWAEQWAEYADQDAAYWTTINNDTYNTETHATNITLKDGSVWNVTEDSEVTSLTVDETSKVVVAEGVTLLVNGQPYGQETQGYEITGADTVKVGEEITLTLTGSKPAETPAPSETVEPTEPAETTAPTEPAETTAPTEPAETTAPTETTEQPSTADEPPANSLTITDPDSAVASVVYASDTSKTATDCPRTGIILTLKAGYGITAIENATAETAEDGTITVTPDPGPNGVTITIGQATASTKADTSDAAYQTYLVNAIKTAFAAGQMDSMTEDQMNNEFIPAIQAGNYSDFPVSMLFESWFSATFMTYDQWVANGGADDTTTEPTTTEPTTEPTTDPGEVPDKPADDGSGSEGGTPIPNTVTFEGENFTVELVTGDATDDANVLQTAEGTHEVSFKVVPADGYTVESVGTANNVTWAENDDGSYSITFAMEGDTDATVTVTTAAAGKPDTPTESAYSWNSSDSSVATVTTVGDGTTATVTGVKAGTVTISVVDTATGETVATKEITVTAVVSFPDVSEDMWYAEPINAAAAAGIVKGYDDGTFKPDKTVTRAEAAKMIALAAGLEIDETAVPTTYTDCSGEDVAWALPYIAAVQKEGYMKGIDETSFDPSGTLTRAQLAALICQVKGLTSTEGAVSFPDVPASEWYAQYVDMASAAGLVQGHDDGKYAPLDSVTRAQFAQIIYNMYLK